MKTKKSVLILIGIGVGILSILTYGILEEEKKIISSKVLNSGFERGLDKPYSWSEDARGGWSIDKEDPYIGDRCMQATEGWSWLSQKVPVEPEKFYRLRTRLKSDIKDRENVFLTLECLDKDGEMIKREWGARSATSSWHLKESSIFTPKDTKTIKIRLAKRLGEGSVWFDEVKLEKTSSFLLSNPGFERGLDKPDSWVEDAKGGWSIDKEDPYIGDRCMQATESRSYLWRKVPVEPEKFYRLKARLKSDIEDRENALLTLMCLDEDGKEIEKEYGVRTATSSWDLKESSIFTPKGTKMIKIRLAKRLGEGSVWFDEVRLAKTSSFPLLNPGFERGLDKPDSWSEDAEGGWSIDKEDPYIGDRCMQVTESWSWLFQKVSVEPEKFYRLKARLKSDIKDRENALLTLECLDKDGETIKREYGVRTATSSWDLKESSIFTPKDTKMIRIKLAKRLGEGSVWFDEVELEKTSSFLLSNPGFERGLDKPDFWVEDAEGGWSIDKEDPYIGDRCMQATESRSWLFQKVPVEPEKFYRLKARLKSDIKDRENVFLTLECLDKDGEVIKREWGARSATSSWHLKESSIFTLKDTKMIKIRLAKRLGEGSVWFDEVELEKTSSSLLSNPGFEMGLDKPDSWVEDAEGGWSIDKEDPYIGDRCIQATESWSSLWQKVPVEPEKFYRLKVRLKSDIKDRENTLLTLTCLDKDGKEIEKEYGVRTATSSWHLKESSIFTPKGTKTIKIRLAKRQGEGSVWFDEVEFKESPLYMRIKFLRGIAEDKPFFIFYFLVYALLLFFLLRIVFKK